MQFTKIQTKKKVQLIGYNLKTTFFCLLHFISATRKKEMNQFWAFIVIKLIAY